MESAFSLAAVNATYEGWWIHMDILMPLTAPYGCLKKWGEKSSPKRWIKYWNMWYHKCLRQYEKLTIHTERLPGRQESSSKVWTELKEQNITDLSIHRFDESTQMRPAQWFEPAWERTMGAFGNMGQERKRGQWVSRAASNQMSHFDSITGTCLMPHFLLLSYAVSWNKSGYFQSNGGKGILDRKSNRFPLFHMPLANNAKNRNSF